MNDFETRLSTALRASGDKAPLAVDLATSARERRRWQIRTRYGVALGAAAAIAAAALVIAPQLEDPSDPTPPTSFAGTTWIPDGWRTESVGDVELAVPAGMPYGDMTQACVGGEDTSPVFYREGGVSTLVGCPTTYGYGVTITAQVIKDATYPEGAVVRTKAFGDQTVLVVLDSEGFADEVLGTAHRIEGIDSNGCPDEYPIARLGLAATVGKTDGTLSVCRYAGTDGANLLQSERLSAADSDAARAAIAAAPNGTGPDASEDQCLQEAGESESQAVVFRSEVGDFAWVHYDLCRGHAVDLGGSTKKVTAEVMHWALSPGWSGGMSVSGLIDDLRTLPNVITP